MEDRGGIDQASGLAGMSRARIGQGEAVPGVEPGERARRGLLRTEPLGIDGEVRGVETGVRIGQILEPSVVGARSEAFPIVDRSTRRLVVADVEQSPGSANAGLAKLVVRKILRRAPGCGPEGCSGSAQTAGGGGPTPTRRPPGQSTGRVRAGRPVLIVGPRRCASCSASTNRLNSAMAMMKAPRPIALLGEAGRFLDSLAEEPAIVEPTDGRGQVEPGESQAQLGLLGGVGGLIAAGGQEVVGLIVAPGRLAPGRC